MHDKVGTFARIAFPVDCKLILYGVSGGVLLGLIALFTRSTEEATALGIALAVSVSIGGWLGINLWLLTRRLFRSWSASLANRLEALAPIAENTDTLAESGNMVGIESVLFSLVPGGFAIAISAAMLMVIDLQVDLFTKWAFIPTLFTGLGYALSGLAVQGWYLWRDSRRVARLERQLESAEAVAPVTLQTPRLELAISRANSIVCKLTGVGCSAGDETAMV